MVSVPGAASIIRVSLFILLAFPLDEVRTATGHALYVIQSSDLVSLLRYHAQDEDLTGTIRKFLHVDPAVTLLHGLSQGPI